MHSLPISALGHCHLSVSVCLCRVFFSPIWPLDDETAAPVFWHELSLHIRPLWWRLSAWHACICPWLINPHTHMCTCSLTHSNTHITSGSPTTSRLFLSYTRTRCPTQLSITAPEKVGWTNLCSPQRDIVLADTSDRHKKKKRDTRINTCTYCTSTITIISCLHQPFKSKDQAGICIQALYIYACIQIQSHMPGHSSLPFSFWYDTWLSREYSLIEAMSALQLMADKRPFYRLAACCFKLFPFLSSTV